MCFAAWGAIFGVAFAPVWWLTVAALVASVALARRRLPAIAGALLLLGGRWLDAPAPLLVLGVLLLAVGALRR
jgi:hypothetical protein